jgi:branched-chain amino acid transport system ATP-binding protein
MTATPSKLHNPNNIILDIRDLTVSFGTLVAVNKVSFTAQRGHITAVIGPNGAGKSTLFNLISGAITPSAGSTLFDGVDLTGHSPMSLMHSGLSRSFQITNIFFELTVYENLRLASQILEPLNNFFLPIRKSKISLDRTDELITQFNLESKVHQLAGYLSHGEQRRLEIAVSLASRPKMLLLDEPTQGMSHADTEQTGDLIKSLAGNVSILLVEHDVGLVMKLSDHVVVMNQGEKLAEGLPAEIRENQAVQAAYFGQGAKHA